MHFSCRWEILLSLWIQVLFAPGIQCKDGAVNHLSREDVLLLKRQNVSDPKCFSRTESDFTCFFETRDNRTYDFLYNVEGSPVDDTKRCDTSVRRTENGTFLHICSFPESDVHSYVDMDLVVVERDNQTRICSRTVSVEDNFLLHPPTNVTLHQNDKAGQLQVSWHEGDTEVTKYRKSKVWYKIRCSTKGQGEKIKEWRNTRDGTVVSVVPGEQVQVQVSVKCGNDNASGHWSHWSHPVEAVAPQSADDISLFCFTSDLRNITCQWNGSRYSSQNQYKLYYKTSLSGALGWTEWAECLVDSGATDLCSFHGDESRTIRVKLSNSPAPLSRTFFTPEFTLNRSIKTSPPGRLRGAPKNNKLCLKWEAPLQFLSANLEYEVGYQIRDGEAWMTVSLKGPEPATCLEVPTGSRYSVKVRAKPTGSIYSGHWSDWSDVITGNIPTDMGIWLMLCIPVMMLITVTVLVSLFSSYLSKLKQYFWPPVPNLDKVLQGFLTEINKQKWDPPVTSKQCCEDTAASVVQVMSEDEVLQLVKPLVASTQLLSPEGGSFSGEQVDWSLQTQQGLIPDYVTLKNDSVILCPNSYVYEQVGEKRDPQESGEEIQNTCSCTDESACDSHGLGSDFLNHSYLPLAELVDRLNSKVTAARGPGNLYTNFPCS